MDKSISYILEVARCGGISKAAANLYITPSALSKFVQSKEDELGVLLFDRQGKKFSLTYAGERYVEISTGIARMQMEMEDEMNRIAAKNQGRLRIGFQMTWADVLISKIIPDFRKKFPEVQVVLEESYSEHLIKLLEKYQLDMVVTSVDKHIPGLNYEKIADGELILAVPVGHRLIGLSEPRAGSSHPWVPFEECADEPAVMLYPDQMYRVYADQIYAAYGITPHISIQAHSTKTALLCVANHLGITVTLDYLIPGNGCSDRVKALSFGDIRVTKELAIVSSKDQSIEKVKKAFLSFCHKHFDREIMGKL